MRLGVRPARGPSHGPPAHRRAAFGRVDLNAVYAAPPAAISGGPYCGSNCGSSPKLDKKYSDFNGSVGRTNRRAFVAAFGGAAAWPV